MSGCEKYLNSDLTKCHTCDANTVPVGASNTHTACTACAAPKKVLVDEANAKACVTVIEGCSKYRTANLNQCHTCGTGFTGTGTANQFTACACTKSAQVDENGAPVCVTEITNCMKYSSSNAGKCHTCAEGITGTGGSANARDACPCASPKVLADKKDGSKICLSATINFCNNYLTTVKCDDCATGFTKSSDSATCGCATPKAAKKDNANKDICVNKAIEKCEKYASVSTCETCETGYDKSTDKTTCEQKEAPAPSSGSIVSFSVALLLVLFALI